MKAEPEEDDAGAALQPGPGDEPVPGELIEPGRALALGDFSPPEVSAGERLMRLAYRMGVPGEALRSPFRKGPRLRLLATVSDPLPGHRTAGNALRLGHLLVNGGKLALDDIDFSGRALAPPFERALHSFRWLDDLAGCAPRETCAPIAERLLAGWLAAHPRPGRGPAWSVGHAGHRLLAWLVHAPLLLSSPDKAFRARVLTAIGETARWLDRHVGRPGDDQLAQVAGWTAIVAAGLLLPEGKPRRLYGEAGLIGALGELVGDDGGVLSRSPLAQIEAIALLVRLTACYRATRRDPPEQIAAMLAILVPPLLGVLHGDGGLGSWQGTGGTDAAPIEALLAATGVRARPLRDARQWGYQRVTAGPADRATVLLVDAAPPPVARHARDGCASTLAFELSAGAQRLIVNCGGAALAGGALPARLGQSLRATAAHSTLVLDDNNSTAVLMNGRLGAGVSEVVVDRRAITGDGGLAATRIEASHDGYAARFGLTHRRVLVLDDDGRELRGEDLLVPVGTRGRRGKVGLAIRFHLAPGVVPELAEDGQSVALALPDGSRWRFVATPGEDGVAVTVDDSLWVDGHGRPRPTRQIVIQGPVSRGGGAFAWLLERLD
ncbi:MAG: heparinase II/III family protein [Novosphingobium sp.]